jgi:hypothetical protein
MIARPIATLTRPGARSAAVKSPARQTARAHDDGPSPSPASAARSPDPSPPTKLAFHDLVEHADADVLVAPAEVPFAGLGLVALEEVASYPLVRLPLSRTLLAFDAATTNGQAPRHEPVDDPGLLAALGWLAQQQPGAPPAGRAPASASLPACRPRAQRSALATAVTGQASC